MVHIHVNLNSSHKLTCGLSACLDWTESCVCVCSFTFHFYLFIFLTATFDFSTVNSARVHCLQVSQITFFSNFFIKNGSHSIIYTLTNYFTIVFSVSVFSFSKNKLYPNELLVVN